MDFLSLQSIIFLFFISLWLYLFSLVPSYRKKPTNKTGFKNYPILGTLPVFLMNRHRFLEWTTDALARCPSNTAVYRQPGKVQGVMTASPAVVEHILKTNFENYPKGDRFTMLFRDMFGQGIFNSDGELWKVQRKMASYEFNTKSLKNLIMDNVKVEISLRLIPILSKAAKTGQVVDLQDILERFAFDNICKLAFNVDPGCLGGDATSDAEFMLAFETATTLSSGRFMYAFPGVQKLKKFLNIGAEKDLRRSIKIVHEFADEIVRSRMEAGTEAKDEDLLSRFMANRESSPEFLRDIVISFILAGRDTTSSALTWFFWLLSVNPEVDRRISNELESIRARSGKIMGSTYSFEELREMQYLHAAISESMRLYPPVPVDSKACKNDDVLPDGTRIKKGWLISYHTYAMGRMESIWGKDCDEFRPERWLEDEVCRMESPFKYPVFHAGPRICLGKDMAFIQMKSIVAALMERFEIDVQRKEKSCPEYLLSLTLRMKGGLQVKVKEIAETNCH